MCGRRTQADGGGRPSWYGASLWGGTVDDQWRDPSSKGGTSCGTRRARGGRRGGWGDCLVVDYFVRRDVWCRGAWRPPLTLSVGTHALVVFVFSSWWGPLFVGHCFVFSFVMWVAARRDCASESHVEEVNTAPAVRASVAHWRPPPLQLPPTTKTAKTATASHAQVRAPVCGHLACCPTQQREPQHLKTQTNVHKKDRSKSLFAV